MTRATFPSWAFPGIPSGARLLYAEGKARVPAAGGSAFLDGIGVYGGTGYLYRHRGRSGARVDRAQVIGFGAALYGSQDTLQGGATLAAGGGSVVVQTLLGLGAARPEPYESLVLHADGAGVVLVDGATTLSTWNALRDLALFSGQIPPTWTLVNNGGAPHVVGAVMNRRGGFRRLDAGCQLVFRRCDPVSGAVIASMDRTLGDGESVPRWPVAREDGEDPALFPVAENPPSKVTIAEDEAVAVRIGQDAGGVIPSSAWVIARVALAVW